MKRQIRHCVFETNSSTCHTLVIPKRDMVETEYPIEEYNIKSYDSDFCFGRGLLHLVDDIGSKIAYVFMLLCYDEMNRAYNRNEPEEVYSQKAANEIKKWSDLILGWVAERAASENTIKTTQSLLDWLRDEIVYDKSEITEFGRYAWIEHPEEMMHFVNAIKNNNEVLKKFLFDVNAYATVCGDEYRGAFLKKVGFEYDYSVFEQLNQDYTSETWENKLEEVKKEFDVY